MITDHQDILEVASEETINEIIERYLKINVHANSYVLKRLGKPLGKFNKYRHENNFIRK